MKNRVAIITTAIALVALMIVGATLAWFTDTDTATNAVTMGNLDIEVWEYSAEDDDGKKIDKKDGMVFDDVVPGDKYVKAPYVLNTTTSVDSYIRAQIVFKTDASFETGSTGAKNWADFQAAVLAQIVAKDTDWVKIGDYYYYVGLSNTVDAIAGVLAPGEITATLFDDIEFPGEEWGNEMAGFSFTIDIIADGMQVKNQEISDADRASSTLAALADLIAAKF